jgi:hypothetical protein
MPPGIAMPFLSHHRAVIELARARIVDDVGDHEYWRDVSDTLIPYLATSPFTVLQVFQMWLRVRAITLDPELTAICANQQ